MPDKNITLHENAISWLEAILRFRLHPEIEISYSEKGHLTLGLLKSNLKILFDESLLHIFNNTSDLPCTYWNAKFEGFDAPIASEIPAPGASILQLPLVEETDCGFVIHYDLLGAIFWMLSRYEEVARRDLDAHARFPATASHAFKHGYLNRPVVDEWIDILGQILLKLWPQIVLAKHLFSIKASHDVDVPSRFAFATKRQLIRRMAGNLLVRREIKRTLQALSLRGSSKNCLNPKDPANTFDWLMDVSDKYQIKSAFYFISGRTNPKMDADYELGHPAIRHLLRKINARGHEIGLHPSYDTYMNHLALASEAAALKRICLEEGINQTAWGGRMHYLRWAHPSTLYAWESAKMTYDSTLGYPDHAGFRCGTCFEYQAFDPVTNTQFDLLIRPLIVMDVTVVDRQYMGLGEGAEALECITALKDKCKAVNGCFTLLWHNSNLTSETSKQLYENSINSRTTLR
jgi:hypothetical protein